MAICLIGIGRMGEHIAANLAHAGYQVHAYDIDPERGRAVLAHGARLAASAEQAAVGADVLLTVLPGPAEVTAAVNSTVLQALAAGATWIDMSSNIPAASEPLVQQAAAHGVNVLEAPMGGSPADAATGELRLFVGGDEAVLARHRRMLSAVATRITHVGGHGAGYTAKLLVNLLWFGQAVATAEALLLAQRAGIDAEIMAETLATGPASSAFIQNNLPSLLAGDYLPTFGLDHIRDQLAAVTDLAEQLGTPHSLADAVLGIHDDALQQYGPLDGELLAVALLEKRAGTLLRSAAALQD
ncbi:NAD(P)-binding domain-containing protein [Streptomyces sp. NPDC010273]|uniref:NAD(P)-dependent oxidoreductase n=1 Tax=Streptomyces sp. NPDC010273 TaxID=3364829 RepID=UPI0036EDE8DA